ncbi:MAG: hypothetical protein K8U03_18920 [Planctomycetia bacterium]|nr:hypothetical protein [Planctomycetia bacterium]
MTVITLPNQTQIERRHDRAHTSTAQLNDSKMKAERAELETAEAGLDDIEENCPVIRASRIVFSTGRTGRTRVVFF